MSTVRSRDKWRLYQDLAWTFPIVSPPEDYAQEARQFWRFLRSGRRKPVCHVLHLGSGAGLVDSQLKPFVRITGVDLSPAMLRLARSLNPEVRYRRGDMRSVRLGKRFDGVLASDAIAYMRTPRDLTRAFETAYRHLEPGGAFVTYGEHIKGKVRQNYTKAISGRKGDTEVVFVENLYDPDVKDTTIEGTFVFLIRRGSRLSVETDCHVLGLFPETTWKKALRDAGFEIVHAKPDPRGPPGDDMPWFVGRRPA